MGLGVDERDRFTGKRISWDGWNDLFHGFLQVPSPLGYESDQAFSDFEAKKKTDFSQFVRRKGFPMLARVHDIYGDFDFSPDEVQQLRAECISLSDAFAESRPGSKVLKNLIEACDLALEKGTGLVLSGD